MRYLIEAKTDNAKEQLNRLVSAENTGMELISSYDPIENLSGKVEKLGVALKEFKASGINWNIFKFYLRGRGLSNQLIDNVMGKVEDFFKEAGIDLK